MKMITLDGMSISRIFYLKYKYRSSYKELLRDYYFFNHRVRFIKEFIKNHEYY